MDSVGEMSGIWLLDELNNANVLQSYCFIEYIVYNSL